MKLWALTTNPALCLIFVCMANAVSWSFSEKFPKTLDDCDTGTDRKPVNATEFAGG